MKEIHDPTLNFQLSNDFHVRKVLKGYLKGDTESMEFATLLEWSNIYFQEEGAGPVTPSTARLGLVQWEMRSMPDMASLLDQAEFFVYVVTIGRASCRERVCAYG